MMTAANDGMPTNPDAMGATSGWGQIKPTDTVVLTKAQAEKKALDEAALKRINIVNNAAKHFQTEKF